MWGKSNTVVIKEDCNLNNIEHKNGNAYGKENGHVNGYAKGIESQTEKEE